MLGHPKAAKPQTLGMLGKCACAIKRRAAIKSLANASEFENGQGDHLMGFLWVAWLAPASPDCGPL